MRLSKSASDPLALLLVLRHIASASLPADCLRFYARSTGLLDPFAYGAWMPTSAYLRTWITRSPAARCTRRPSCRAPYSFAPCSWKMCHSVCIHTWLREHSVGVSSSGRAAGCYCQHKRVRCSPGSGIAVAGGRSIRARPTRCSSCFASASLLAPQGPKLKASRCTHTRPRAVTTLRCLHSRTLSPGSRPPGCTLICSCSVAAGEMGCGGRERGYFKSHRSPLELCVVRTGRDVRPRMPGSESGTKLHEPERCGVWCAAVWPVGCVGGGVWTARSSGDVRLGSGFGRIGRRAACGGYLDA
ncbi:hypothetical protein C8Q80DRAFT_830323 [Daedaleopsis nitida]|nr:hypothetical protein C8Q80DRAFT_830323 [Daedaleopsis nitida]